MEYQMKFPMILPPIYEEIECINFRTFGICKDSYIYYKNKKHKIIKIEKDRFIKNLYNIHLKRFFKIKEVIIEKDKILKYFKFRISFL